MRPTGVTRCLPTLITSSFDDFAASARVLARMADPAIAGIHMEGPYLSPDDGPRGAHPREHVIAASVEDFNRRQDAADGRIVLVTLAPEVPGGAFRSSNTWSPPACAWRSDTRRRAARQIGDAIRAGVDAGDASRQRLRADAAAASESRSGSCSRLTVYSPA